MLEVIFYQWGGFLSSKFGVLGEPILGTKTASWTKLKGGIEAPFCLIEGIYDSQPTVLFLEATFLTVIVFTTFRFSLFINKTNYSPNSGIII